MYKSGVYIITNCVDDRVYIGSAVNLMMRKAAHFSSLRKNKHANCHLQNFYNKYGDKSLTFSVLERRDVCMLIKREQFYFGKYKNKFNIAVLAGSTLGRVCSEETKLKISKRLLKANLKGIPKSEVTKEHMRKPKTRDHALKIKEAQEQVRKRVYQYDFSLNLINKFKSVSDASCFTKLDRRLISNCCNEKKQNSVHGFLFTFTRITNSNREYFTKKAEKSQKTKNQHNSDGVTLYRYICEDCGVIFTSQRKTAKYCSNRCRTRNVYRNKMNIKSKLNDIT